MNKYSIMQQALGDQWQLLPVALRSHYQLNANTDTGFLDISYPRFMQWPLNFLRLFGVLINRCEDAVPVTVNKHMSGHSQYWYRHINFQNGQCMKFKTKWVYAQNNEVIEYVNPLLGLRMSVSVINKQLHYTGKCFVLKLWHLLIPIPEWLLLGHTQIVEVAINDSEFAMDFSLNHPVFGWLFRYKGVFNTTLN
jgi:hypothetical protein